MRAVQITVVTVLGLALAIIVLAAAVTVLQIDPRPKHVIHHRSHGGLAAVSDDDARDDPPIFRMA